MSESVTRCAFCDEELNDDERDSPRMEGDLTLCDDCYHERYEFTCSWCEEYEEDAFQHTYLAVFDAEEAGVALPGFYRINATSYSTQPLIGSGWIHAWAVTWLGRLQPGVGETDGFPCGHFCRACQGRALDEVTYSLRCGVAAL